MEVLSRIHERYEIITQIGKGGMSSVYLAKDLNLDSYWAVKQVTNKSTTEFLAFKKEVELLASLNHPDIPRIVDRVEIGDDYFVVMDFVDGTSMSKIVNIYGPMEEKEVIKYGIQLCNVLEYLHTVRQNPIVYRDLKPDNIMLTSSGSTKLIDFGIACECERGKKSPVETLGTRGYAAPEQYRGASNILDERTDIYGLGATLFFLASGITPGTPPAGVPALRSVSTKASDSLEYVIAKCTADDPEKRYKNMPELRTDLENIGRLSNMYRKKLKRRMTAFITSVVLSIVFCVIGIVGYYRVQADLSDKFTIAYQAASAYEKNGDYVNASVQYASAINARPENREVYFLLFQSLLPRDGTENAQQDTITAIDEIRINYLDDKYSAMYKNPELAFAVVKRCVEVGTNVYAEYALQYIEDIKASGEEYKKSGISEDELQSYEIMAKFLAQSLDTSDFNEFSASLESLSKYTDEADLSVDDKLANYYIMIQMYSSYPSVITDAYSKALEIGDKARILLESHSGTEELTFNNTIPLYQLIAVGQYNGASYYSSDYQKEEAYLNSIQWFKYLDNLNVQLSEKLALTKANAYKGMFDLYNKPATVSRIDETIIQYLKDAINQYKWILSNNSSSYYAGVFLTQAMLDFELLKPAEERDMENVYEMYESTIAIAGSDDSLSISALMLLDSLKRDLENAGVSVQ